ncbi:hypothetical protein RFI_38946 [Reticulomyxa filosa]|uniref:AAA+ ATPase domain-containing protein n=1 Tax=Reticulomyxa filosa TaxID=46433 RepID=X6LBN3_RETFI|nr:hypothetical protein RFI_38946 [Reticulomyxa filosa]|eukprot:ETN98551.1 hypothetical protein RFI_38946 [Reticulomyxa filosa]
METILSSIKRNVPGTQFFLFNEIHSLIQQIETLLLPSCLDRSVQARKSIKPFLQKVNCQITDQDVDKILQDWGDLDMVVLIYHHTYDTDDDESFKKSGDSIAKFGLILHSLWTCSLHNRITKTYPTGLNAGKPSLILHPNNSLLFEVLGLFESQQCIPRAEHILICNENTTEEDVTCLIFRAIANSKQMQTDMYRDSVKPFYCLAYPENLTSSILDQVCQVVHDLLLNDVQLEKLKHCFYLFVVISREANNDLCKLLEPFCVPFPNIASQSLSNKILSQLYRHSSTNTQSRNIDIEPPWIQLYTSERVGMGKSRFIQRDIEKIRKIHQKSDKIVKDVCVAFNGKDIDWEQTMNSLWSYYPCPADSLVIYHLNISSCVSTQINDFLFQLLFLQHIDSNSQMPQCFHVNSNMIFLIEIPSTLDELSLNPFQSFFYSLFSAAQFPTVQVSKQNNPFEFEKEAQDTIKWMWQYFNGDLNTFFQKKRTTDNPFDACIPDLDGIQLMEKHFAEIGRANLAHQRSFFKYLYQQFAPLVQSPLKEKAIQSRHVITKSVIDMAKTLYCCSHDYVQPNPTEKSERIESTGDEEFHLCKKWRNTRGFFLVNQDKGSNNIYIYVYNLFIFVISKNKTKKYEFNDSSLQFNILKNLNWQQDLKQIETTFLVSTFLFPFATSHCKVFDTCNKNKKKMKVKESGTQGLETEGLLFQTEKERKLRVLLHILGTPKQGIMNNYKEKKKEEEQEEEEEEKKDVPTNAEIKNLHDQIVNKLCKDEEWSNYVLTFDNLLKMVAIFMKIRTNTPVILMGETGCGKTSLIKFLGHTANVKLIAVDVHGGFGRDELRRVMEECNTISRDNKTEIWVFVDEVNTSPDIGWFKELICDHSLDGVKISDQIKIIAACNPYRPRKIKDTENKNISVNDPNKWVYHVFPLCETMKEYVWLFGQLSELDEKQYIRSMVKQLKEKFDKQNVVYKEIEKCEPKIADDIMKSHHFLRKHLANESIVSLRDVSRCLKFFHWLMQHSQTNEISSWIERALNISLGLCYYFRLDESRKEKYDKCISGRNRHQFSKMLNKEIDNLSESFEVQSQVVMHHILKKNLFPGTSKTLSLRIMLNSLSHRNIKKFHAELKKHQFHFNMKSLHCISFQGTRNCKPNAIKEIWDQTERYSNGQKKKEPKDQTITTFLLFDEIGLAEQSPYNPLKKLHQLLEDPKIPFVGISNWNLDAAKMNRMVMHFIPSLGHSELMETAQSIVPKSIFEEQDITHIIKIYEKIVNSETDAFSPNGNKHFFGARDFYALVKHQATLAEKLQKKSLQGYLRNFGGLDPSNSREQLCMILEKELGQTESEISQEFQALTPVICVQRNLMEKKFTQASNDLMVTRHCMIISEKHYSWQLLLEYNILNYDHVFLFGSYFENDTCSNISNYNQLNNIIDHMDTGKTVILSNLEDIYESLYEMLNQRYEKKSSGVVSTFF